MDQQTTKRTQEGSRPTGGERLVKQDTGGNAEAEVVLYQPDSSITHRGVGRGRDCVAYSAADERVVLNNETEYFSSHWKCIQRRRVEKGSGRQGFLYNHNSWGYTG